MTYFIFLNADSLLNLLCTGLAHLHSLSPRLVHKDFKTANVLVDENFIPKVADAGLRNFLGSVEIAGSSSQVAADEIFLAPEYIIHTSLYIALLICLCSFHVSMPLV